MKKQIYVLLLVCLLSLSACGQTGPETTDWTALQMAQAILDTQGEAGDMTALRQGEESFRAYLTDCYQLDPGLVEEGTVLYAGGVSALEIGVLRLTEGADAGQVRETLEAYIESRAGAFTGYAPEEAAILEQSAAVARGRYAALLICPRQQAARDAFDACFEGAEPPADPPAAEPSAPDGQETPAPPSPPPQPAEPEEAPAAVQEEETPAGMPAAEEEPGTENPPAPESPGPDPVSGPEEVPAGPAPAEPAPPPETPAPAEDVPWRYDSARLIAAWEAGDWTGLGERDQAILQTCSDVLAELISGDMTDYDKELAIHDWMIGWGDYDREALSQLPTAQPDPDNGNPYGFLVNRTGICRGYTSTFQLLMDLVGIECVTVAGTSHGGTEEHAWNMVRMEDGEWYCVDVTWDDPISALPVLPMAAHMYFNVTSDFLRLTDHQWDSSTAPEATATSWRWQG